MASTTFGVIECCALVEAPEVVYSQDCCRSALRAMEEAAMSLSAWEQQSLDSIKDGLTGSDPQLAALLTTFTRLASGEEMPVQEEILAGSGRTIRHSWRTPRHRRRPGRCRRPMPQRVSVQWAVVLVWLVITVVMITIAVVMSSGGSQGACQGPWPVCTHSAPG